MAAMGRFVQQGREKLCLIRPKGDALALETLFLSADVYSQAEIEEAVEETTLKQPELALAQQVIESLSGDFDASELQSDYRRDLKALLEAKRAGEEITAPEEPTEDAPVIDLMEALRRSVETRSRPSSLPLPEGGAQEGSCTAQVRGALAFGTDLVAAKRPFRGLARSGSASADSDLRG
jgi:DNA end-binding protein Ku